MIKPLQYTIEQEKDAVVMTRIIYDLECENGHRFEGWFRSAEDFATQQTQGIVSCPNCADSCIRKIPSRINLGSHADQSAPRLASATTEPAVNAASVQHSPSSVAQMVINVLMANSEDVGSDFADEARKIHLQEAPARNIRGIATEEDYEALSEEGIDILRLPIPKKENLN